MLFNGGSPVELGSADAALFHSALPYRTARLNSTVNVDNGIGSEVSQLAGGSLSFM